MALTAPPPLADAAVVRGQLAHAGEDGGALLEAMRGQLAGGREALRGWFLAGGDAETVHRGLAGQMDALLQGGLDYADGQLFRRSNPTTGEQLAVIATGGYGRGELAPASDIDLLFLHSYKRSPYVEQMAEFLLYKLWDLGLKVGQATRSIGECVKLAGEDLSVRTAILEARFVWGDRRLFDELRRSFHREVVAGREADFIEAKLAERDARHQRVGDSRYLLEPNIKEGKGGLRDLHTLFWIGRFLYAIEEPADLVQHGVLTPRSLSVFLRSRRFLWAVRCHLHYLTGRAEERLTFDVQPEVARRMGFRDRSRSLGVERFMKRYYLVAKDVGGLTRLVCSALEEQHKRRPRLTLPRLGFGRRRIGGFVVQGSRVGLGEPDLFERRPVAMLELFRLAQQRDLDIHPAALTALAAGLRRVDQSLRADPEANRLFLEMLLGKEPALTLGRMNEAGLLGRFVPDFGRVVAQMQHNLYHVYTVDEHTIRAIDVLWQVEQGRLAQELPLSTELMPKLLSRRELYLATFLHDIGKGRGGDHSRIGAEIALRLGPRLGLPEAETETVAWLVEHHLLMSGVAFKRDAEDPKTIQDFVHIVQSPERLKLLVVLTTADIRAVGPNVWNGWKGQLLRELYHEAAAAMAAGDTQGRRAARGAEARRRLADALGALPDAAWPEEEIDRYLERHDSRYWLAFPLEEQVRHARLLREAQASGAPLTIDFRIDSFGARTELLLHAADHPGLFMKVAGALALSGASIVDARIFTTTDGMALDALGFQDAAGRSAVEDPGQLGRIARNIERAMRGELELDKALAGRRSLPPRTEVFKVEPRVLVDNKASRTHSVIEVNGRDRPGLLFDLARALKDLGLVITSAHISTYGERVVDVFYVKDVFGLKITSRSKLQRVTRQLEAALASA
ncbi:[protein-PII] uridylyltransferase [Geminicoccaceae bacterium 1502E]|nr:[protein-PII] uridylyltransferase [Geminicoccaceae bacterium 1502E]